MIVETVTLHYPATDSLAAQKFYFASEDGEKFYELDRLPAWDDELPSPSRQLSDGRRMAVMSYARRYFTQQLQPGVRAEFKFNPNAEAAPVGTASDQNGA